jgi:site-specific DNA recombinase
MSRTAHKVHESLSAERELERAEVPVFAANEPIMLTGGRAQQILQLRISQSVAEYEVLKMLELSRGLTKARLEPDALRGVTVTLIAKWRYQEQLGFDTIAERLNQDLDRYAPPEPLGGLQAAGCVVDNRRARRSRTGRTPPETWVWSAEPHMSR